MCICIFTAIQIDVFSNTAICLIDKPSILVEQRYLAFTDSLLLHKWINSVTPFVISSYEILALIT